MSMVYLSDETLEQVVGGGLLITAEVGIINDKNGTKIVTAPSAANKGVLNAFSNVLANTGGLANIDVNVEFVP